MSLINSLMELPNSSINPFYLPMQKSKSFKKCIKNTIKYSKRIIIICLQNSIIIDDIITNKINLFYNPDTEINTLIKNINTFDFIEGPIELIQQKNFYLGLIPINQNILKSMFTQFISKTKYELVYLMLETKKIIIDEWIAIYYNNYFNIYIKQKILVTYYDIDSFSMTNNLIMLMNNSKEFRYWEDKNNCEFNLNAFFRENLFFKINIHQFKTFKYILEYITKNICTANFNDPDHFYGLYHEDPWIGHIYDNNKCLFSDKNIKIQFISGNNDKKINKYEITQDNLTLNKELIINMLTNNFLSEKDKYYIICNILISKDYCHYILNNKDILKYNYKIFQKYNPAFRYLLCYSWISLYLEEKIVNKNIQQTDRIVFDIETASSLPKFLFDTNNPYNNPYFSVLISEKLINKGYSLYNISQSNTNLYGIIDHKEFIKRLNIFMYNVEMPDLLDGVNWSNMVITGDMMAAIIPSYNPLINNDILDYFNKYYKDVNIDILCNHESKIDFIKHAYHIKKIINYNIKKKYPKLDNVKITSKKSLIIKVNIDRLKEKYAFKNNSVLSNITKEIMNCELYITYFYKRYILAKEIFNKTLNTNIKSAYLGEIHRNCDIKDIIIIESNNEIMDDNINNLCCRCIKNPDCIEFIENIKFKISSSYLNHDIKIIKIPNGDFFNTIANFHLSCNRAYYNGISCYMLPSSIISYVTLINIDHVNCFDEQKKKIDLDKLQDRGYGILLNELDIASYITNHFDKNADINLKKYERKYRNSINNDNIMISNADTVNKFSNIFSINAIKKGQLKPLKRWVIDAIYDILK